jgi:hypothetical protein
MLEFKRFNSYWKGDLEKRGKGNNHLEIPVQLPSLVKSIDPVQTLVKSAEVRLPLNLIRLPTPKL